MEQMQNNSPKEYEMQSSTWEEKERDLFLEQAKKPNTGFYKFGHTSQSIFFGHIADYWIGRLEIMRKESYARGRADEIKRNIELMKR